MSLKSILKGVGKSISKHKLLFAVIFVLQAVFLGVITGVSLTYPLELFEGYEKLVETISTVELDQDSIVAGGGLEQVVLLQTLLNGLKSLLYEFLAVLFGIVFVFGSLLWSLSLYVSGVKSRYVDLLWKVPLLGLSIYLPALLIIGLLIYNRPIPAMFYFCIGLFTLFNLLAGSVMSHADLPLKKVHHAGFQFFLKKLPNLILVGVVLLLATALMSTLLRTLIGKGFLLGTLGLFLFVLTLALGRLFLISTVVELRKS